MSFEASFAPRPFAASPHASADPSTGPWLLLAEMNHRVANEYALAVSSIRRAARHAAPEARADLLAACERLHDYAQAHRAHLEPIDERTDLADYLAHLCLSVVRARLAERGVALRFIAEPFEMSSGDCWRVGLIVSELITNALKHGASGPGAVITVELRASAEGLDCAIRDNGGPPGFSPPGHGARIVDGLAEELGARLNRCFGRSGSCVVLSLKAAAAHH
jgi:two-component sensor histidine kinase